MDGPGGQKEPRWEVLRDVPRRNTLSPLPPRLGGVKGGGGVLGAVAEKKLIVEMAETTEIKVPLHLPR